MAKFQEICEQQGVAIEKLLEVALKNLEANKAEICFLQQEREILEQKIKMQQHFWAADNQHFEQRLALNEIMYKEKELTRAYEVAKSNLSYGAQQQDALLFKLRLECALDDLEGLQMRYEFLMLQLKEEQAKAQASNQRLLESEKEIRTYRQGSQRILEVEQRAQSLQELLVRMEKDHFDEMTKVKNERKRINSLRKHEVSALLRERDFVWNQLNRMEEDYADRFRSKTQQLQVACQSIEKLRSTMEELQHANNEKNVELTILKIEMGEQEREFKRLKEDGKNFIQELRSPVRIMNESKEIREKAEDILSTECAGGAETKGTGQHMICTQDINTRSGTLKGKNAVVFENEKESNSSVFLDVKEKQEKTLKMLQPEIENLRLNSGELDSQLRDQEMTFKSSVTSKDWVDRNLTNEFEEIVGSSDHPRCSSVTKLLSDCDVNGSTWKQSNLTKENIMKSISLNKRQRDADNLDFQCDGKDNPMKSSSLTKETTIRSISSDKRQHDTCNSDFQVQAMSGSTLIQSVKFTSPKKKSLRPRGNGSQTKTESQKAFGYVVKYDENLRPVKANFFSSSFSVPKVKGTPTLS
eukprot:Gb_03115 [translate_table: standard]